MAVKVTGVPEQMDPEGEVTKAIAGVTFAVTVMVTELDVAGLPATHGKFEVITQVTISLLLNPDEVKVGLFVPTGLPFILH